MKLLLTIWVCLLVSPSHPTRVRGLKHFISRKGLSFAFVAPHAGAWIETKAEARRAYKGHVAPHAGAWIETDDAIQYVAGYVSRTPRGCVD